MLQKSFENLRIRRYIETYRHIFPEENTSIPKLAAPEVSVTSGSAYDTLKVENPVSNGAFAAELRCFIDGELVTTKTPPEPGAAIDITDVSIFNGKEGPQTMTFCFTADGFERSEYYEHQTDLTEVVITPETVSDGYDYPAIRTGGTYQGIISEKNKTNGYLPPSVSVLKGGADCGYTWDHDVGIDTTFSGNYIATRCRNGSLTVPNVDRKLEVNIPYTELPQLDPVRFSTENGKVVVIPPGYAQTVTVLVDGQVEQTIQGASYTLENMGGDNGFTLTGGSFGVETGSVPQAFCSNAASGIYRLSKIVLNAPEAMIRHTVCRQLVTVEKDSTKTKASRRGFPLTPKAKEIFQKAKESEQDMKELFGSAYVQNDYVFKWPDGRTYSPDFLTKHFPKVAKACGLPVIRFHDLRHSCASVLLSEGFGIKDVQEWLGHSDIQTTANIYGHLDFSRKRSIADRLSCELSAATRNLRPDL